MEAGRDVPSGGDGLPRLLRRGRRTCRVSEIWDSREQWQAFGERLMPVLADVGIQPGEPDVYEVRSIVRR